MGATAKKFHWIQVACVIISHTNTTVIGNVIRTGRPAITMASIQNIFRIPSGVMPMDIYLAKFSFPLPDKSQRVGKIR